MLTEAVSQFHVCVSLEEKLVDFLISRHYFDRKQQ